jgi:lipoate-protein ligase A
MRHIDLGTVGREESQAVYHAVAECVRPKDAPTLITVSPERPYVCVGYHQLASREIDREYCASHDIAVGRRMVGGGAVYLDGGQVFWHLVMPRTGVPVQSLYDRYLRAPVAAYRRMGIAAEHRPVNDIVVGPQKIGGTGAATLGDAMVLVGSLMFDFDSDTMTRVLRVPSEKFRDKMLQSLSQYMTTMRAQLGDRTPTRDEAVAMLVEAFSTEVGEPARPGTLTDAEREATRRYSKLLFDPAFVYASEGWIRPGVTIREGVRLYEGVHKAPGGLVRVVMRERDGRFDDVLVSGDFFVDPADGLAQVGQALVGLEMTSAAWEPALERALAGLTLPGVTAADIGRAMAAGVELVPEALP